jgi:hypothetical protein
MEAHSPLAAWETFFFLIGSSAAALTGLQFVVIALIAESSRRATPREIEAFSTPTIVHFAGVLLVSAIVSAPWYGLTRVAVILGACGLTGIVYTLIVVRRTRRQTTYRVVFEDWLWHVVLPFVSYVLLLVSAIFLPGHAHRVLFVIGATALLLLFIGLHNAWDTVTYITLALPPGNEAPEAHVDDQLPPAVTIASNNKQVPAREKSGHKFRGKK